MANLLDQASIVLTPTAYDNGKVLCAKPSEAPYGDFDFSRNSAATRVNAQGLVENVQILSSNLVQNPSFSEEGAEEVSNGSFSQEGVELVTNGDFATDSDWTLGDNTTISNGSLNFSNAVASSSTDQFLTTTNTKIYKVTFSISNYVSGSVRFRFTGNANVNGTSRSANGTFTQYIIATADNAIFRFAPNSFTGSIDNVSCVEVGQDWTLGTGWSIADDKAVCDGTQTSNSSLSQNSALPNASGKTYKIVFTISDYVSGGVQVYPTNTTVGTYPKETANGTYTKYVKVTSASPNDILYTQADSNFIGSITNISVKEVGMDWTFGTGWSIAENLAIYDDSANGNLNQSKTFTSGKKYNISFEIKSGSGSIAFLSSNGVTTYVGYATYGIGTHSVVFDYTTGSGFGIFASSFLGGAFSITNISVIEITDDTNLPRINYEGFSYQDALGSEEVVNGDFATDSNWTKGTGWTISGGLLNASSVSSNCFQSSSFILGKTYKVTYSISNYVSGLFRVTIGSSGFGQNRSSNGTFTENIVYSGANFLYLRGSSSFSGSIDNVSVKEYLGQSVVPNSGCGSWLFESQSTNLITQSETFSDSSWNKSGSSITSNAVISPDGNVNAAKLIASATNSEHRISASISTSATESISIFAKKEGYDFLIFRLSTSTNGFNNACFDLDNGQLGTIGSNYSNAKIEDFGNGWYRCSFVVTNRSGLNINILVSNQDNQQSFLGDGVSGIYIWGAMLEQNSYSTSYIPTNGSQVTRNQDVCNNGGSLATINSTEGVLYAEIAALDVDSLGRYITISDGVLNNNAIRIFYQSSNTVFFQKYVNGVRTTNLATSSITKTDFNKIAIRYNSTDFSVFVNGVNILNNADTNVFAPNTLNVLEFENVIQSPFFGKTKALAVWKEALSDQELADLTYPTPTDPTFTLDFDTIAEQFTFARGSEATYVDAQGLIQSTNEIGEELITNGDGSSTIGWNVAYTNTTLSINNNNLRATANASGAYGLSQILSLDTSKQYLIKATINVDNASGSTANLRIATSQNLGVNATTLSDTTGTSTTIFTPSASTMYIGVVDTANNSSNYVEIDNISVKEYITATNTPRLDYSTGAEAFLLEPQTTQLLPYSEDFSQWTTGGDTTIESGYLAPDGTNNAYKVSGTTSSIVFGASLLTTTTRSIYARTVSGTGQAHLCSFNGNSNNLFTITEQWQRFEVNSATATGAVNFYGVDFRNQTNLSEIILWGANATNDQDYATSYIPSNGSQTTRNQETCINATPEINSEEGVLYAEIAALSDDGTSRRITLLESLNDKVSLILSSTSNSIQGLVISGATVQFNQTFATSNILDFNKIAVSYAKNNFALWVNGAKVRTDTSGNTPIVLSELSFADGNNTSNKFFGKTKDIQVYTKALSDAELIKLTT